MFLWTHQNHFENTGQKCLHSKSKKFFYNFSPKFSSGHVKCSFDNPDEKYSLKIEKYFAQFRNKN